MTLPDLWRKALPGILLLLPWGLALFGLRPAVHAKQATPTLPPPHRPPAYPVPWAPSPFEHFLFGRPFPPNVSDIPLPDSRFGTRMSSGAVHMGVDLPAGEDTPVLAIGDGEVIWAGEGFQCGRPCKGDPYGIAVLLRHDRGWNGLQLYSLYAHMGKTYVAVGERVRRGQRIGVVGTTGHVTGPHLHLEIRYTKAAWGNQPDQALNPELWIVPIVGWGTLVGRIESTWGWPVAEAQVYITPRRPWTPEIQSLWRGYHTLRLNAYARGTAIHSDPLYRENFVAGNLPAGEYVLTVVYRDTRYATTVRILPGRVTFFRFQGIKGFVEIQFPLTQWPPPPNHTPSAP